MKKIILSLLLLFSSLACANASTLVKVGITANYPPFEYLKNGKLAGFDYDLLCIVAKKANLELKWQNMSFSALIPALKTGKIDMIISAMSNTPKRSRSVDFSDTYFLTKNVYLKKDGNLEINSLADLPGKKVGVQLGSIQEARARKIQGIKLLPAENIVNSVMALKAGKIDVVLADKDTAQGYLAQNKGEIVGFYEEADGSKGFAMAFDKGKQTKLIEKINKALREIKQSGEYDKLIKKYNL